MLGVQPNRERFLASLAERVSPDRVQVLYLFAPIRQGAVETGVAVIAMDREQLPDPGVEDPRPVVLTARYRHTLKGPDRGKWEMEVHEQADAPLATLERVMRGVQERLDEDQEPERLDADALRAAKAEGVWTAPQR